MLYKFMHFNVGEHSWDWLTFILNRKLKDLKIRKYPDTIGVSTRILMDLIGHGTKNLIVKVDGVPAFKTDPKTWLEKSIIDKLSPDQDPHAFLSLNRFQRLRGADLLKGMNHLKHSEEESSLTMFL